MDTESLADAKARAAAAWESAEMSIDWDAVDFEQVEPPPRGTPPGFSAWAVGDSPRSVVVLPTLRSDAPGEAKMRYVARIVAVATGHCPLCDADASLSSDPESHPGEWRALPLTVGIVHADGCGAVFGDEDRSLFPVFNPPEGGAR